MPIDIELADGTALAGVELPPISGDPLHFGHGPRGWLRAGTSFLAVLTLILIGLQFIFSMYRREMNDPDIWWHLRNAQYLVQQHQLPRADMYSFTVTGHPWSNHEWLAELPYYFAYRAWGPVGLKTVSFLTLTTIFLLVLHLCYQSSRNFKASIAACCVSTFLTTISFGPRTILFGYLYLAILLVILTRFRRLGDAPLWVIPPLFCLWINTHGSWSIGLIVFFLISAAGFVHGVWGRVESDGWTPKQIRELAITSAFSVAALFLNPFGWRLVYYPFDLAFKQNLNITHIAEWVSIDFHTFRGKMVLVLIVGFLLAALVRNRRWNLGELLVFLFALYSGLTYIRFLALLGIVCAPVLAKVVDFFPPYRPADETPKVNLAVILLLLGLMIYNWPRNAQVRNSILESYPSGMLTYLQEHPPQGNVLNFYLWGGYLEWHAPTVKVFINSRVDIFEYEGVLRDYLELLGTDSFEHRPDAILKKYKIDYVLFPRKDNANALLNGPGVSGNLVYLLERDPNWKTLYKDDVSVLLGRQNSFAH